MSKLTEIKQRVESFNADPNLYGVVMTVDEMNHLLSLLEEKDKALTSAEWSIEHMLREQPNEMWTEQERESWESFGKDSLKEIKVALNTSSNNEGER
ncbi:hypothetical protein [Paenibacillus sp. FSL L8-0494]|uniref:hypothetical protein n=1 Tax=Paenibacillus sp. FSL L8-0494 TaxID=2975352 RepID=UPI0030F60872